MVMPNLIEVQRNSYKQFLDEGLRETFREVSPIQDFTGNLVLEFIDYKTIVNDNISGFVYDSVGLVNLGSNTNMSNILQL